MRNGDARTEEAQKISFPLSLGAISGGTMKRKRESLHSRPLGNASDKVCHKVSCVCVRACVRPLVHQEAQEAENDANFRPTNFFATHVCVCARFLGMDNRGTSRTGDEDIKRFPFCCSGYVSYHNKGEHNE